MGTLRSGWGSAPSWYVLVSQKSTSTHNKFISDTSLTTNPMETSAKSTQTSFPTSTVSYEDSLASLFLSLENDEVLKIPEGHSSLSLREYCKQNDLDYSSLKMWSDSFLTTTEKLSLWLSPRLQSWGMTVNGKCLTAKITEYPRIGRECSLSDILEEQVDQKYFLSEAQTKRLMDIGAFQK